MEQSEALKLLSERKITRKRHQRGCIQERSNAFYLVYRQNGKQHCKWLCAKDRNTGHGTRNSAAVRELAEDFMRTVNTGEGVVPEALTVVAFWEQTYLPFIRKHLKPTTGHSYEHVWDKHLREHFGSTTLREYRTGTATKFLTNLSETYRPYTVRNVRSTASAIFAHAVAIDEAESNPWHDAKVLGKQKPNGVTGVYSLEEIENIITALVREPACQLIMALCYFAGLRRAEIQGLQWGDVDDQAIHIRRNRHHFGKDGVGTPKTEKSVRSVPIIEPVRTLLMLWRRAWKANPDGWVFDSNLQNIARKHIRPVLTKAGLPWKGFHSGRRGLGTTLRALTGNSTAAKNVLGHGGEQVTQQHYEAALPEEALRGMKLLEAKVRQ